jgi:hypothetical protein
VRKKKKKRFRASTEVRAIARERLGSPPPERVLQHPKFKPEKHKKPPIADF